METFIMNKHTLGRHSCSENCTGKSRDVQWVAVCNLLRTGASTSGDVL